MGLVWGDYLLILAVGMILLTRTVWGRKQKAVIETKILSLTKAERSVWELLKQEGYILKDVHCQADLETVVDGRSYSRQVRADFLIQKNGKLFVVVVQRRKTAVPRQHPSHNRLRIMDYYLTFFPDGVIIIDPLNGKNRHFAIKLRRPIWRLSPVWAYLFFILIGALLGTMATNYSGGVK